jgi:hypothetical protein
MNRKTIITIAVVVVAIGLLFVTANIFQKMGIPLIFLTGGIGVILVGAWIYMVWMILRKKTNISDDQMEPEKAEKRYKILKVSSITAGVLLLLGVIGAVGHNALYAIKKIEESVFFFIAIIGLFGFVMVTIGSWIYYLIGRKAT